MSITTLLSMKEGIEIDLSKSLARDSILVCNIINSAQKHGDGPIYGSELDFKYDVDVLTAGAPWDDMHLELCPAVPKGWTLVNEEGCFCISFMLPAGLRPSPQLLRTGLLWVKMAAGILINYLSAQQKAKLFGGLSL